MPTPPNQVNLVPGQIIGKDRSGNPLQVMADGKIGRVGSVHAAESPAMPFKIAPVAVNVFGAGGGKQRVLLLASLQLAVITAIKTQQKITGGSDVWYMTDLGEFHTSEINTNPYTKVAEISRMLVDEYRAMQIKRQAHVDGDATPGAAEVYWLLQHGLLTNAQATTILNVDKTATNVVPPAIATATVATTAGGSLLSMRAPPPRAPVPAPAPQSVVTSITPVDGSRPPRKILPCPFPEKGE